MKYLKLFEELDTKEKDMEEIGDNLNEILYDIVDDGFPHLYPAWYNNKLHRVGGLMMEIAANDRNEYNHEYFEITDKMVDVLERCIDYIKTTGYKIEIMCMRPQSDEIEIYLLDGDESEMSETINVDNNNVSDILGIRVNFIGITVE